MAKRHLHNDNNNNNKKALRRRGRLASVRTSFLQSLTPAERLCALFSGFDGGQHSSEAASPLASQPARTSLPAPSSDSTPFSWGGLPLVKSSQTKKTLGLLQTVGMDAEKYYRGRCFPFVGGVNGPGIKQALRQALQI